MGVLPLQFLPGEGVASLGLTGREALSIGGLADDLAPRKTLRVTATSPDGSVRTFDAICRLDGPIEVDYYRQGGILPAVLRRLADA